jgi:hypothetical protein
VEQSDSWQKGHFAAAHVVPTSTDSYFIIVAIEESPEERTHWALVYGSAKSVLSSNGQDGRRPRKVRAGLA